MSSDPFRNAEDEFFVLKGQLAAGRITQAQFDAALKDLMVQDAQGRYWMIGPDSGDWYVHDGQTWVEAQPPIPSLSEAKEAGGYVPAAPPSSVAQPQGMNLIPILAISGGVILCLVGVVALLLASNLGILKISMSNPTATLEPFPTIPVLPTLPATLALPTAAPSMPPVPSATPISPIPSATAVLPTLAPTIPLTPTISPTPIPSRTPTASPTPTPSPTPTIPPGLYVTDLRLDPPSPRAGQEVVFYVTFLNTATGAQNSRWLVYIYKADNLRNSSGETAAQVTSIPIGAAEQKALGSWKVGIGSCGNFVARAAWQDESKKATPFTKPDGQVYELPFSTCP